MTHFVQPEKIEIDANERAVNEKSPYCFFVCTTFDSFLNDFTNRVFEEYYPIEEGSMEKMSQNLEGLCDEWELDFKQSFFIHLIVEELLLNIMKFGIGETDKKYYVSVKVMDNNGECILRIRDNVNSYNPFDLRGDEVDRAVMEMIKKKAKYYEYQRKLVFNYLYVTI